MQDRKYFCQEIEIDYLVVKTNNIKDFWLTFGIHEVNSTHFATLNTEQISDLVALLQRFLVSTSNHKKLWEDLEPSL